MLTGFDHYTFYTDIELYWAPRWFIIKIIKITTNQKIEMMWSVYMGHSDEQDRKYLWPFGGVSLMDVHDGVTWLSTFPGKNGRDTASMAQNTQPLNIETAFFLLVLENCHLLNLFFSKFRITRRLLIIIWISTCAQLSRKNVLVKQLQGLWSLWCLYFSL